MANSCFCASFFVRKQWMWCVIFYPNWAWRGWKILWKQQMWKVWREWKGECESAHLNWWLKAAIYSTGPVKKSSRKGREQVNPWHCSPGSSCAHLFHPPGPGVCFNVWGCSRGTWSSALCLLQQQDVALVRLLLFHFSFSSISSDGEAAADTAWFLSQFFLQFGLMRSQQAVLPHTPGCS